MDAETKQTEVMECPLSYLLSDENGREVEKGEAKARLSEEDLSILPKFKGALFFPLMDILKISDCDYKIHLIISSKEKLTLSNLGYRYEDFLRVLSRLRNELLLKHLLCTKHLKNQV